MATTPRASVAGHTLPGSKLRRVTEHIQAHLDQDLTLAHLGAVVYMSPYHFARRFQHSTGLPPHRFVVQQRIARARAFLATQEQSVAQISRLVGFRTPSHFTTVFRRVTGLTPGPTARRPCEQTGPAGKEGEMNVSGSVVERTSQEPVVDEGRPIYPRQGIDRDAALVAQLHREGAGAAAALVGAYGDRVYRLALRITGNASDAEEVVQDALWAVSRKIDTFRGAAAFGSWVYRITANAAYQKLRARRSRRHEVSWEDLAPAFDENGQHVEMAVDWSRRLTDPATAGELKTVLGGAIDELPADYRTAFLLHDVEGLSNPEIAETLHVTLAASKSRVHRARLFLRKRLADYMGTAEAMPGAVGSSTSGAIHRPLPPLAARATPGRRPSPSTVSAP